jgi:hypothetical protein
VSGPRTRSLLSPAIVVVALVCAHTSAGRCAAQFVGLGAAANYGILEGGGTLNLNQETGTTNVAATSGSQVNGSSGGGFTGTLYVDNATTQLNGFTFSGGTVSTSLSTALSDAVTASSSASAQTATQTVPGGAISGTITINGSAGQNVIDLTSVNLNSGTTLTIHGTSTETFIFNVSGSVTINTSVVLSGGVTANHVIFNVTGGNTVLGGNPNATILDLNNSIDVNNTNVTGALLSEQGINLSSGTFTSSPFHTVPEPSSLVLGAIAATVCGGMVYRRRRPSVDG